ncbi:Protein mak11 [Cladophialophora chaetospira]|uniref:Protein mak11 n=1 Tax=Cladophialophora chaetospira TaxID=386627 RepID=A0AA38X3P0_9EURO|nr:Protein mak11 [Cladophialophora chaetospira]
MAKRKRDTPTVTTTPSKSTSTTNGNNNVSKVVKTNGHVDVKTTVPVIQIVTGSYERVLHGITASISNLSSSKSSPSVQFADTFLFNAHAGSVRCLALSPLPDSDSFENQGVYLASGGSDEKINVFSLSATPVSENEKLPPMPSLGKNTISENSRNRELGTLLEHSAHITALHFPTRSKLLSGSEDNTIAVTRLKDLTTVSTIKAPRPKVQGQSSGDTAPPGATPAGINDFSVHPSMKVMLSVGRGERCMRLWNLVTGKKAGVLNFNREILQSVRESKYSSGEGRRIRWSPDGNEFAVAFERGVVIFGEDSKPKCKILPQPVTKLHQIAYISSTSKNQEIALLAVSTEDGRILFYDTQGIASAPINGKDEAEASISQATLIATVGGKAGGITTRIKDFEVLFVQPSATAKKVIAISTASSDGTIRVIQVPTSDLFDAPENKDEAAPQLGTIIGSYETGNRITCLKAFVMLPARENDDFQDGDDDFEGFDEEVESEDSGSDSDED